jgi:hypothetical protein
MPIGLSLSPVDVNFDVIGNIPVDVSLTSPLNRPLMVELKPLTATLTPLTVTLTPLTITLAPIEIRPIDFTLRIKEIPSVRVRLPMDYKVCFNLFGNELGAIRFCGQGQVITEPYVANPCECRPARPVINAAGIPVDAQPALSA